MKIKFWKRGSTEPSNFHWICPWTRNVRKKALLKHAFSNILKVLPPKYENFQINYSDIFHTSAENIDCGYLLEPPRRGSSNEYPQSMFLSENKKNNVYPCKHQFCYIELGFKGVKIIYACFRDGAVMPCADNKGPDTDFPLTGLLVFYSGYLFYGK